MKALSSSILGRIRPLIFELLALEWLHTFELEYLWSQLVNLYQILCVASLGWGKGCIRFWGRLTWHIGLRWAIVALWATCFIRTLTTLMFNTALGGGIFVSSEKHCSVTLLIWAATWQNQQKECVPSLIRVFAVRMKKAWFLSYPLSTQQRLWSDWADAQADLNLRWAHSHFVGFVMSRLHLTPQQHGADTRMITEVLTAYGGKQYFHHKVLMSCQRFVHTDIKVYML